MTRSCDRSFFSIEAALFRNALTAISIGIVGVFCGIGHCAEQEATGTKTAAKSFRLADGTQLPIEEWPKTYQATIWQPPIDIKAVKIIVEYQPETDLHVASVALDLVHRKVYWARSSGGGRHGAICRANLDGSAQETLINENPLSPGKEMMTPHALCVVPELSKMFWVIRSFKPTPGSSILEADLAGRNPRATVNGLDCRFLFVDRATEKIFWNDGQRIQRSRLDFSEIEDIGAQATFYQPVAIDLARNNVYAKSWQGLVRQSIDGAKSENVFWTRPGAPHHSPMQIAGTPPYLYWEANLALVRAPLDALSSIERLTEGKESEAAFAVDVDGNRIYWAAESSRKLVVAPLPKPWSKMRKPAPPMIESWSASSASSGQQLEIKGSGFQTTLKVFWVGHPSGECLPSKFQVVADDQLKSTTPKFASPCREASLIVVSDGGATVTLPASLTTTRKSMSVNRSGASTITSYLVQEGGWLSKVEGCLVFVEAQGAVAPGPRAGNVYFVKNGGHVHMQELPSYLFFEPHAQIAKTSPSSTRIPVSAIRASYVDHLVKLSP